MGCCCYYGETCWPLAPLAPYFFSLSFFSRIPLSFSSLSLSSISLLVCFALLSPFSPPCFNWQRMPESLWVILSSYSFHSPLFLCLLAVSCAWLMLFCQSGPPPTHITMVHSLPHHLTISVFLSPTCPSFPLSAYCRKCCVLAFFNGTKMAKCLWIGSLLHCMHFVDFISRLYVILCGFPIDDITRGCWYTVWCWIKARSCSLGTKPSGTIRTCLRCALMNTT